MEPIGAGLVQDQNDIPVGVPFWGISDGSVLLIDVLERVAPYVPGAHADIAVWTVGMQSLARLRTLMEFGSVRAVRLLIDRSYGPRNRAYTQTLVRVLGKQNIRTTFLHANFIALYNDDRYALISASMNLNKNRRYESFCVLYDRKPVELCRTFVNDWFVLPPVGLDDYRGAKDQFEHVTSRASCGDGNLDVSAYDVRLEL